MWNEIDTEATFARHLILCFSFNHRQLVPIFVLMSGCCILMYFHFLFGTIFFLCHLCGRSLFRMCCDTSIPHNKFRCKIASFFIYIHSLSPFFFFFCLYQILDAAPFIYVLSTTTCSYIWIRLSYSARTSAYFFLFKTYVYRDYIPPRSRIYIDTTATYFTSIV